jgi:hypothetical protein
MRLLNRLHRLPSPFSETARPVSGNEDGDGEPRSAGGPAFTAAGPLADHARILAPNVASFQGEQVKVPEACLPRLG